MPPQRKWTRDHPFELIIGDAHNGIWIRSATQNECLYSSFVSHEEPDKIADWVITMQEELNKFESNKVWKLVSKPKGKIVIDTKWVLKKKVG